MLNVIDLNTALDSLNKSRDLLFTNFTKTMLQRSNQPSLNQNYKITEKDSLSSDLNILKLFNDQKAIQLINISQNSVKTAKKDLKVKIKRMLLSQVNINKHIVALHDKFALGLSCIILFFVGAPLGALIRKGGIGLPLVIAILIFLTYHFISIFAKNSSEDSSMDPVLASWLSSLILLPFSVYLTNRATKDRALIDVDSILIPLKTLVISSNDSELSGSLPTPADKISELKEYENTQLIGIIKEYRNLGHSLKYRNSALQTLNQRGVSELELKMGGYLTNPTYENALRLYIDFKENSKLALVFYLLTLFTGLIGYVLNNIGFDTLGSLLVGIAIVSIVFYLIVMQKSVINQSQFYKIISVNFFKKSFILILLGLPLFYFYRSFFTSKMEEELLKIT
jgi:lipopolysaccharide export system permease protein